MATSKLRVLICGDRFWKNKDMIRNAVEAIDPEKIAIIIDGAAPGADHLGNEVARELKIPWKRFPAKWALFGKAAGPKRNQQMIDEGRPNLVLAFHDNLVGSKGTKDMVARAIDAGIKIILFETAIPLGTNIWPKPKPSGS